MVIIKLHRHTFREQGTYICVVLSFNFNNNIINSKDEKNL